MEGYVMPKYGKTNWMKDDSWTDIILNDVYNTFYRDEEEETQVAKESEDMAHSVMKEDLWLKYGKDDKGKEKLVEDIRKGKEAEHHHLKVNKEVNGKGNVHDIQNRVGSVKVDLAMVIKANQIDDHDDDDLDTLDLEIRIKNLEEDFGRLLKAKKAKESKKAKEAKKSREAKKEREAELAKQAKKAREAKLKAN
ncbi:hypothetical protein Tco_0035667, partial [Tanacetum coccineum]